MIFISYSWKDKLIVNKVEKILNNIGAEYWIDRIKLDLNGCIKSQIYQALQESSCVLHVASKASRVSEWVSYEKRVAYKLGLTTIELDIENNAMNLNKVLYSDRLRRLFLQFVVF